MINQERTCEQCKWSSNPRKKMGSLSGIEYVIIDCAAPVPAFADTYSTRDIGIKAGSWCEAFEEQHNHE